MLNQNKNKFLRSLRKHFSMVPRLGGDKMLSSDSEGAAGRPSAREKTYFYFGFSLIVLALLPIVATAQFNLPSIGSIKPTISLNSDPLTPSPDSAVTITANLTGITGGGDSNYNWFLNGVRQNEASGLNKNTLTFKTGAIGTVYRVSVNIKILNEELSDAINLTVSDVDLTWAANSEAPAIYRAKLMPTQNSIVTVSALSFVYQPGTKKLIGSNNLIYNWIIDDKFDSLKSGLDKNSYILRVGNFFGNPYTIRLEVKTADGAVSLNKFIIIPVVRPQIWLYFSDAKTNQPFGIALKNLSTSPANLNFIAQPYFFTAPAKNLKWQWFINDTEAAGEKETPWLATLNLADNFSGLSAQIKIIAQNPNNELENAQSITNLEVR